MAHIYAGTKKNFDIDFDNLNAEKKYDSGLVYSYSKLCNVLFTNEL
jgi:hypothetical protein